MRSFKFWVLLSVVVSAVLSKTNCVSGAALDVTATKHKDQGYNIFSTPMTNRDLSSVNKEDYPCIDPSPGSKASIRSGPIEHGTPLMPYVPRATPPAFAPSHPRHVSPP